MTMSYYWSGENIGSIKRGHHLIEIEKGSPDKAKYVIFYAVEKDPAIFCKTKKELTKELAKLHKRDDVKQKSIKVFELTK